MVTIRVSPGAAMESGSSAAASAAAANVAPAAITGMAVRGRRVAQNGLRRVAAGVEWLLNIRLFSLDLRPRCAKTARCMGRYAEGDFSPVQFATLLSARRNLWRSRSDKSGYGALIRTFGNQCRDRAGREFVRHVRGRRRAAARGA